MAAYLESLLPSALESTGVLPVAVITAVWSSSMGMVAVIKGLDQIYGAKEPGAICACGPWRCCASLSLRRR